MNKFIVLGLIAGSGLAVACGSSADKVSENLSKEAEKFNVVRSIVGINGITDKVAFEVRGRCSVEGAGLGAINAMTVVCKDTDGGKNTYKKHFVGVPDNLIVLVTQLDGVNVSEFRSKIVLKPQNLIPDLDLVTSSSP